MQELCERDSIQISISSDGGWTAPDRYGDISQELARYDLMLVSLKIISCGTFILNVIISG